MCRGIKFPVLGVGVFALTSALTAGLTWGISTVEDLAGGTYCLYSDRDCYDWVEMVRKVSVEGVNIEIVNQSAAGAVDFSTV